MNLNEIIASKEQEVEKIRGSRDRLRERADSAEAARDFAGALGGGEEVAVIAEFKRKSPSMGTLNGSADPAEFARGYEAAGAAAISVLTDGPFFGGSLDDIARVREAASLPVLRKDFVVDPVQLVEARAAGADAVLLITRVLEEGLLSELLRAAGDLGLAALVEVHREPELERAVRAGAEIIGVNARDLNSFAVDLNLSEELLRKVPSGVLAIAESGIRGRADVIRMAAAGADAVLVGGWLMRHEPSAVSELSGVPRRVVGL